MLENTHNKDTHNDDTHINKRTALTTGLSKKGNQYVGMLSYLLFIYVGM